MSSPMPTLHLFIKCLDEATSSITTKRLELCSSFKITIDHSLLLTKLRHTGHIFIMTGLVRSRKIRYKIEARCFRICFLLILVCNNIKRLKIKIFNNLTTLEDVEIELTHCQLVLGLS